MQKHSYMEPYRPFDELRVAIAKEGNQSLHSNSNSSLVGAANNNSSSISSGVEKMIAVFEGNGSDNLDPPRRRQGSNCELAPLVESGGKLWDRANRIRIGTVRGLSKRRSNKYAKDSTSRVVFDGDERIGPAVEI